jgi:PEP-CTERM motif
LGGSRPGSGGPARCHSPLHLAGPIDYVVQGGTGTFNDATNTWTNPEGGKSVLLVTATVSSSPSAVPEPATLMLLGTGLAGVAAGAWRKRRHG